MNYLKATSWVLIFILASSCSVVKQNGYYQSRKYKPKNLNISYFKKKVPEQKQEEILRVEPGIEQHGIEAFQEHFTTAQSFSMNEVSHTEIPTQMPQLNEPEIQTVDSGATEKVPHPDIQAGATKTGLAYLILGAGISAGLIWWGAGAIVAIAFILFIFLISRGTTELWYGYQDAKSSPEKYKGKGLALSLLILNISFVGILTMGLLASILIFALQ
ncbi:hypothetical protein GYB22_03485 [bacterium]|nr:hypothetical protein [bacterium]